MSTRSRPNKAGLKICPSAPPSVHKKFSFEIPRNSPKIRTYSSSRSSKIISIGINRKRNCDFLFVINSNFGRISYHLGDIDTSTPPLFDAPSASGGMPCDINVIYTPLKSTFNGLVVTIPSLTIRVYLHSFSRCSLPNLQNPVKF